ncbi:MAG: hypothetical protein V2I35_09800, partial [Desulfocapsaceae bacterium]|nr:hypothetical protein [Desulfocapsaceae bacterium]
MEKKQRIDKITRSAREKIQDEIGSLLGSAFSLEQPENQIVQGQSLPAEVSGKQVVTSLSINAGSEAHGFLLVSARAAIRIGGTLIMLPSSELDDLVETISYDEEIEDSYGEIGNIITGVFTALCKELPETPYRFEAGEQKLLQFPADGSAVEHPVADGLYYQVIYEITLGDKPLGPIRILLPAVFFGLADGTSLPEAKNGKSASESVQAGSSSQTDVETDPDNASLESSIEEAAEDASGSDETLSRLDIDAILELCRVSIQEEVGEVIGAQMTCSEMSNKVVDRQQFFSDEVSGRQLAAALDVSGDEEGRCYLYLGVKDAIRVGCTLLMMPSGELEAAVRDGSFSSDAADAYDEIINVISRIYTNIFDENFNRKLKFSKGAVEQVDPEKITFTAEKPLADKRFYLHKLTLGLDGQSSGQLQLLLPLDLLGLNAAREDTPMAPNAQSHLPHNSSAEAAGDESRSPQGGAGKVLII